MLTLQQLVQLDRDHRDALVLSAYLVRADTDPAAREARVTRLESELSSLTHRMERATRAERLALDAAIRNLRRALGDHSGDGSPLVAFTTADAILFAGRALAPVAQMVRWGRGLLVAPYMRSVKHEHPVLLVSLDSRQARLFRYQQGEVTPVETFEVSPADHPPEHMGDAARLKFHPGVRGTTGTDEALRRENAAFNRMLGQLIRRLESERDRDPWIVIGGMPSSVREVLAALPRQLDKRAIGVHALSPLATLTEVAQVASEAASELTARRDQAWVESVLEHATGRALVGVEEVQRALAAHSAHLFLISASRVDRDPLLADSLMRAALDGGTPVEVVSGPGASRLDAHCDGVAVQLRFAPPSGASDTEVLAEQTYV